MRYNLKKNNTLLEIQKQGFDILIAGHYNNKGVMYLMKNGKPTGHRVNFISNNRSTSYMNEKVATARQHTYTGYALLEMLTLINEFTRYYNHEGVFNDSVPTLKEDTTRSLMNNEHAHQGNLYKELKEKHYQAIQSKK